MKTAVAGTNAVMAELDFGALQDDKVFARRADETSVYAVRQADYLTLPAASWQLRQRQILNLDEGDVTRVLILQQGKTREIIHSGPLEWALAPGSQGIIEPAAIEATAGGLCRLAAVAWTAHGEQSRARFGFKDDGHAVTLELKNGEKFTIEFGGEAPSGHRYAAMKLDGQLCIFELSVLLYRDVLLYLAIP